MTSHSRRLTHINNDCDKKSPCNHTCVFVFDDGHKEVSSINALEVITWVEYNILTSDQVAHFTPYFDTPKGTKVRGTYAELFESYYCHKYDDLFRHHMLAIRHLNLNNRMVSCIKKGYAGFNVFEDKGVFGAMTSEQRSELLQEVNKKILLEHLQQSVCTNIVDDELIVCLNVNFKIDGRNLRIEPIIKK